MTVFNAFNASVLMKKVSTAVTVPSITEMPLVFSSALISAHWNTVRAFDVSAVDDIRKSAIRDIAQASTSSVANFLLLAQLIRDPAIPAQMGALLQPVATKAVEIAVPMYTVQQFMRMSESVISKVRGLAAGAVQSPFESASISLLASFYLEAAIKSGYVHTSERIRVLHRTQTLVPDFDGFTNMLLASQLMTILGKYSFKMADERKIGPNVLFDQIRLELQRLAVDIEQLQLTHEAWVNLAALSVVASSGSYRIRATPQLIEAFSNTAVAEFQRNVTLMFAARRYFGTTLAAMSRLPVSFTLASSIPRMAGLVSALSSYELLESVPATWFYDSIDWHSVETPTGVLMAIIGSFRYATDFSSIASVSVPNSRTSKNLTQFSEQRGLSAAISQLYTALAPLIKLNAGSLLTQVKSFATTFSDVETAGLASFGAGGSTAGAPTVSITRIPVCANLSVDDIYELIAMGVPGVTVSVSDVRSDADPIVWHMSFVPLRTDITLVRASFIAGRLTTDDPTLVYAYNVLGNNVSERAGPNNIKIAVPYVNSEMIGHHILDGASGNAIDFVSSDPKNALNRPDVFTISVPGTGGTASSTISIYRLLTNDIETETNINTRRVYAHHNKIASDLIVNSLDLLESFYVGNHINLPIDVRRVMIASVLEAVIAHPMMVGLAASVRMSIMAEPTLAAADRAAIFDHGVNSLIEVNTRVKMLEAALIRLDLVPFGQAMPSFFNDQDLMLHIALRMKPAF